MEVLQPEKGGLALPLALAVALPLTPTPTLAQVEVLQPEKGGLAGARYAAQVLATEI